MYHIYNKHKYIVLSCIFHAVIFVGYYFFYNIENRKINYDYNEYHKIQIQFQNEFTIPIASNIKASNVKKRTPNKKEQNLFEENNSYEIIEDRSFIKYKTPKYPKKALLKQQQGEVIVRLLADKFGDIQKIVIYKSSNYPLLDNAVLESAQSWKITKELTKTYWIQIKVDFIIQ